jgi:hypothetical protein
MRLTRNAIVALLVLAALGAGAAQVLSQRGGGPPACRPGEREQVLRQEQRAVLRRLGPLTTLRNEEDLATLGKPPYNYIFLAHRFTSFEGIGLTIINGRDTPRPGVPNLIWYEPREGADSTEPERPDFPYELAGWGYGIPYKPGPPPRILACTTEKDWMIHERGVHPIDDGGFVAMPPAESYFGEAEGGYSDPPAMEPILGWPHTRSWTIHLWLNGGDVPDSSILDLEDPPSGVDPGVGSSFYYPGKPPKE